MYYNLNLNYIKTCVASFAFVQVQLVAVCNFGACDLVSLFHCIYYTHVIYSNKEKFRVCFLRKKWIFNNKWNNIINYLVNKSKLISIKKNLKNNKLLSKKKIL